MNRSLSRKQGRPVSVLAAGVPHTRRLQGAGRLECRRYPPCTASRDGSVLGTAWPVQQSCIHLGDELGYAGGLDARLRAHLLNLRHTWMPALARDGQRVFPARPAAEAEIVGGCQSSRAVRTYDEGEVLQVIVPVLGADVEGHPMGHLLDGALIAGHHPHQLQQLGIVQRRIAEIDAQEGRDRLDVQTPAVHAIEAVGHEEGLARARVRKARRHHLDPGGTGHSGICGLGLGGAGRLG